MMKQKKVPMRMCVGCREMKPKRELLRVVRSPEGEISFDLTGRKSGRGAYVCRSQDCLQKAVRQHQLERAFSAPVSDAVRDALMAQLPDLPAPEYTDAADELGCPARPAGSVPARGQAAIGWGYGVGRHPLRQGARSRCGCTGVRKHGEENHRCVHILPCATAYAA